jgi:hypothetical protein
MVKRQLLFFAVLCIPIAFFFFRTPRGLAVLPVAFLGAWWSASPVSYPRWILHGLVRAVPVAVVEWLALWGVTR